jgi:hypothetical protein
MHGGAAPQVKAKAEDRLRDMVDPALNRLLKLIDDPFSSTALAAVKDVLDRNGYGARQRIEHSGAVASVSFDIDNLIAARLAQLADRGQVPDVLALEGQTETTDAEG